jgi:RimJ/RimL family protein N-acetyltransferase
MNCLETARLVLRTWRSSDIDEFVSINADPAVHALLPGPMRRGQIVDFIAAQQALWERDRTCYFAAELKQSGRLAGFVGLKFQDFDRPFAPCFELGWRLGAQYWGHGYATEGAKACIRHGFNLLGLEEIVAFTVPGNVRSRRVMERLGMHCDPRDDFAHPALPADHRLSAHVLYRLRRHEAGAR